MPRKNYLIFALLSFCCAVVPVEACIGPQCNAIGCFTCDMACSGPEMLGYGVITGCNCDGPEGVVGVMCQCEGYCPDGSAWPCCGPPAPPCTSDCTYNATRTESCGTLANGTYNGTQTCNATKDGVSGCYTWGSTTGCARVCEAGYYLNGTSCSQCPNITAQGWGPSMYGSSAAGSTGVGNCYIPGGTTGISDGIGTFTTSGNCLYQ